MNADQAGKCGGQTVVLILRHAEGSGPAGVRCRSFGVPQDDTVAAPSFCLLCGLCVSAVNPGFDSSSSRLPLRSSRLRGGLCLLSGGAGLRLRGDLFQAAQVGAEGFGDGDGAVGVLVVLQDGDEEAGAPSPSPKPSAP